MSVGVKPVIFQGEYRPPHRQQHPNGRRAGIYPLNLGNYDTYQACNVYSLLFPLPIKDIWVKVSSEFQPITLEWLRSYP